MKKQFLYLISLLFCIVTIFFIKFFFFQPSLWDQLASYNPSDEKPMVIVIPSYNNKNWYEKNLSSVLTQQYKNYRVIYLDDVSTDGTSNLVEKYIKEHKLENKITLIKNKEKQYAPGNFYHAAQLCKDHEIMVHLDGDDWLAHQNILALLNKVYHDPNVWMTYGQYEFYPSKKRGSCKQVPRWVIKNNSFREYRWKTSHLRTHYAWLFKLIKREDLFYQNTFFSSAGDYAIMLPMLEMAGFHAKFIPDILYCYNRATQLNDDKLDHSFQVTMERSIRAKQKYEKLKAIYSI